MFKKKLLSVILLAAVLCSVCLSPFINTRFSETSGNVYADGGWSFGVEQFVRGLYQGCLEREPEWDGLSYWCTGLASGQVTGKEAARGFFFSSEFRRIIPMLTEEEMINKFYNIFLGRNADPTGLSHWTEILRSGGSTDELFAGKTAKSILISCGARLAPFDIAELREIMSYDELEIDTLGDRKTALFIITSDTDSTFDFVTALCCSQMFNILCTKADDEYGGRLPIHVRCLLDEFANIKIPDMQRLIAVIRSREISAALILQAKSQLKSIYKDNADTIEGNCDTTIFLGGKEGTTLKEISETLGKETIDLFNTSDTRGQSQSYGINYQKTGKDLMSRDELAVMDGSKCIMQLRGVRPFLSDKFDITKHKRYKELSEANPKNTFDVEKYLKHRLVLKKNQQVEVTEIKL